MTLLLRLLKSRIGRRILVFLAMTAWRAARSREARRAARWLVARRLQRAAR